MRVRLLAGILLATGLAGFYVATDGEFEIRLPSAITGSETAEPTATLGVSPAAEPTTIPAASATPVAPTATATHTPSATPVPATSTATAAPADTPTPSPELPTATPVPPTATQAPPALPTQPAPAGPQALYLTAKDLKFSPTALNARSGGSITLTLTNEDNLVPHNVQVSGLGTSATCSGPCTTTLSFLAPPPGSYGFLCTVHPYMTGTLIVQ